jgi:hypothetical protein
VVSLEPLLTWLRTGQGAARRLDFPIGTALPDGRLDLCKSDLGPAGAKAVVDRHSLRSGRRHRETGQTRSAPFRRRATQPATTPGRRRHPQRAPLR